MFTVSVDCVGYYAYIVRRALGRKGPSGGWD